MVQGVRTKPVIVLASQKESKLGELVCVHNEWKAADVNEDTRTGGSEPQRCTCRPPFFRLFVNLRPLVFSSSQHDSLSSCDQSLPPN